MLTPERRLRIEQAIADLPTTASWIPVIRELLDEIDRLNRAKAQADVRLHKHVDGLKQRLGEGETLTTDDWGWALDALLPDEPP